MPRIKKDYIEFYITNVCNFNCDNCNRLNNYFFSGHETWSDYAHDYQQWSEKVDFQTIAILGGEPTLHPELDIWISNIRALWPHAAMRLVTNGTRLGYWHQRGLFDLLANTNTLLDVNLHNRERYPAMLAEIRSYLDEPVCTVQPSPGVSWIDAYNAVKDPSWPPCNDHLDFDLLPADLQRECTEVHGIDPLTFFQNTGRLCIQDRQGVQMTVSYYEHFRTAPLRYAGQHTFQVYDSDPEAAHRVCLSKNCTHMMSGKMYKCHHMALLPEFAKQFTVCMTEQQQHLLHSYQPLTADQELQQMQSFIDDLSGAMPQCKLCPSHIDSIFLQSETRKPRVKKRQIAIKHL